MNRMTFRDMQNSVTVRGKNGTALRVEKEALLCAREIRGLWGDVMRDLPEGVSLELSGDLRVLGSYLEMVLGTLEPQPPEQVTGDGPLDGLSGLPFSLDCVVTDRDRSQIAACLVNKAKPHVARLCQRCGDRLDAADEDLSRMAAELERVHGDLLAQEAPHSQQIKVTEIRALDAAWDELRRVGPGQRLRKLAEVHDDLAKLLLPGLWKTPAFMKKATTHSAQRC